MSLNTKKSEADRGAAFQYNPYELAHQPPATTTSADAQERGSKASALKEKIAEVGCKIKAALPGAHSGTGTVAPPAVAGVRSRVLPDRMLAAAWYGTKDIRMVQVDTPRIVHPQDAIVRITSTTICGSDLHMYTNEVIGMKQGDIMGHEFMGVIEAVGPEVKEVKLGDRVVVSAVIACGNCEFCSKKQFSLCHGTNPSQDCHSVYGDRLAGIFGYTHLTGGFAGGQAEFARVPIADMNCLKVPDNLPDEKVLFLSDIVCTGFHATDLPKVAAGDAVVVWGLGPVGMMASAWSKFRGASVVVGIEADPFRLELARTRLGIQVIDYSKHEAAEDMYRAIRSIIPDGPDVCIEAAGFRFHKSLASKAQRAAGLQTDTADILNEMILACKKGGRVSCIGDYFGKCNNFPIGALMEKALTFVGGQVFVQKYWHTLLDHIAKGRFDPTFVITHTMPLDKAAQGYDMFDKHLDNCMKIILKPSAAPSAAAPASSSSASVSPSA